jgi:hypothetical protein
MHHAFNNYKMQLVAAMYSSNIYDRTNILVKKDNNTYW